jgi:hypothetical protein
MLITNLLILITLICTAPGYETLYIITPEPIQPYAKIVYAIGMVEGNCDTLSYNPKEEATGYFQIRPIRLRDYNQRTQSHYTINDMYDYRKANKVFMYYATQYRYDDYKGIAKDWNKSKTNRYYLKVKKYL